MRKSVYLNELLSHLAQLRYVLVTLSVHDSDLLSSTIKTRRVAVIDKHCKHTRLQGVPPQARVH
jgi:hypothetical protein